MPYSSYAEVAGLEEPALQALLCSADPLERVWASWALALRLGDQAQDRLVELSRAEPSAGARRQFVVVLAGYGRVELLAALALGDPDVYVRATAAQYLAVLARPGEEASASLLTALLDADAAPEVRAAVARHAREDAPPALLERVAELLADPSLEVRLAVAERLRSAPVGLRSAPGPLPARLRERALAEPTPGLRRELQERWVAAEGPGPLLRAVADAPVSLAREALSASASPTWAEVAPLAARPELGLAVAELFRERQAEAPLDFWLELAHGALESGNWAALAFVQRHLAEPLLARLAWPSELTPAQRASLVALQVRLQPEDEDDEGPQRFLPAK